jgi:ADP-ribose pyrophosphatase YjhB (NUDIX family)
MALPILAVSALVRNNDKVLLVRRGNPPSDGAWALPGGKVEPGERLADAAAREVKEETAVAVRDLRHLDVAEIIAHDPDGSLRGHYVIVVFAALADGAPPVPGGDAVEARWVPLAEAARLPLTADTARILSGLNPVRRAVTAPGVKSTTSRGKT